MVPHYLRALSILVGIFVLSGTLLGMAFYAFRSSRARFTKLKNKTKKN